MNKTNVFRTLTWICPECNKTNQTQTCTCGCGFVNDELRESHISANHNLHNHVCAFLGGFPSPLRIVRLRGSTLDTKYEKQGSSILALLETLKQETKELRDAIYEDVVNSSHPDDGR